MSQISVGLVEIVGIWSDEEIAASYRMGPTAKLALLAGLVMIAAVFSLYYRSRLRVGVAAAFVSISFILTFVCLTKKLASSLCIAAPLDVVANGVLIVPFLLGLKPYGITIINVSFAISNLVFIEEFPSSVSMASRIWMVNGALLFLYSAALFAAYAAICFRGG